jgi:hypothetical protein
MGDRTTQYAEILECPPDKVGDVLEVLNGYGYQTIAQLAVYPIPELAALVLGEDYRIDEGSVGTAEEVALLLAELETVAFVVTEWGGGLYRFTPELGLHVAATADGEIVISAERILGVVADSVALASDLLRMVGWNWTTWVSDTRRRLELMPPSERTLHPQPDDEVEP